MSYYGRNGGGRHGLVFFLAILVASSAFAQPEPDRRVRTLMIKNNVVQIDGKTIEPSALPDNLDLGENVRVSYSFVGMDIPMVTIGENLFALERDNLVFVGAATQNPNWNVRRRKAAEDGARGFIIDSDQGQYFTFEGELLNPAEAVPRILGEAENLYLRGIQERDQTLFSALARERSMDLEVQDLVVEIRQTTSASDRRKLTSQLRSKLNEIFDLKQVNRRAEIAQMETRLNQLQSRVVEREKRRERLVDQRVNELLGEYSLLP